MRRSIWLRITNGVFPSMAPPLIKAGGQELYCKMMTALLFLYPSGSIFPYSNNIVEYEALVIGLVSALQMEI